ncbi:acyl-CoA thioesterase [Streptomyces sp. NPDC091292]|uniref:acyl-CoA thioesterase n=1 Tax=Streptomyces sp. NPDC091292 TaxID=3365991 RepID=UPI00381A5C44
MNAPGLDRKTMTAVRRRVEHVDTDASGVVHFSRYFSWLETATLENLERLGIGLDGFARADLDLVATDVSMRYHASARFLDHIRVKVDVEKVGPARFQISGKVFREISRATTRENSRENPGDDSVLLASGRLLFGTVAISTGAPSLLPENAGTILKECAAHADG